MNDLIYILIPTYNSEKFIARALYSALNQSYDNINVVVIDNNSIDETVKIAKKISLHDSRVAILVNDSNVGPVKNWYAGVKSCNSKYVKILFSDDFLEPKCIEKLYYGMINSNSRLAYSSVIIRCNEQSYIEAYKFEKNSILSHEEYLNRLLNNMAPVSPSAGLFYRDDLLTSLNADINSLGNEVLANGAGPDLNIFLRASLKGSVYYISDPLVNFWAHKNSITIEDKYKNIRNYYAKCIMKFLYLNKNYKYLNLYYVKEFLRHKFLMNKYIFDVDYSLGNLKFLSISLNLLINKIFTNKWI